MKKHILFMIITLIIFILISKGVIGEVNYKILVITSYDLSYPTSQDLIAGVDEIFKGDVYEIDYEFMDTKELTSPENIENFKAYIKGKISIKDPYDLILTFDDNATNFVFDNSETLFRDIPVVFAGMNSKKKAKLIASNPLFTGVVEDVSIEETFQLMYSLQEEISTVYIISDETVSGQSNLETLEDLNLNIPYEIINFSMLKTDEFGKKLEEINRSDAVLLISAFLDGEGKSHGFYNSLKLILHHLNAPCYHLWEHGIGEGLVGGKVISHYNQAITSASMGKEILMGEKIIDIPLIERSPNVYYVDYKAMEDHNLSLNRLPPESIVINRPPSFRELHPKTFIMLLLSVSLLSIIIIILLIILYYRKQLTKNIIINNQFLHSMVENVPIPLVVKTLDNKYVIANSAFVKFMNVSFEDLQGRYSIDNIEGRFNKILTEMDEAVIKNGVCEREVKYKNNDKVYFLNIKKTTISGPNGDKFIVTISQDLTHIKAYQMELEREVSLKTKKLNSLNEVLKKLAVEDQLTSLYNRRKIDQILSDEYKRYIRYKDVFSFIIGDIDNFKDVNDKFGHQKGDEVLIKVSNIMKENIRKTDTIGRWGGEEFVVICPNTKERSAFEIAEKIRGAIESFNFIKGHSITCSFGVSDISTCDSLDQLIRTADNALYTAKENGRNQVALKENHKY